MTETTRTRDDFDASGEFMTEGALAKALKLSRWTVAGMRRTGTGPPHYRIGPRTVRYHRDDVAEWLHRSRKQKET